MALSSESERREDPRKASPRKRDKTKFRNAIG